MSQRPCRCSPRPLSSSCRCSALTAAGRPRSSDGCKEESSTLSVKMKCDFNYDHIHSGLNMLKPDDTGRLGSYTPAFLEGSYKDCIEDFVRLSDIGSPIVSPKVVELETENENKLFHNKENQHVQQILNSSNEIEELETSRPYEDSGYSSFSQQSGFSEHEEGSLSLENFSDSPQSCLQMQSPDQYPSKNLLPALHFAKMVCSTLKKNAKRNPKIDWEKLKEFISSENFKLQNIIGRKMGLECVDILSELFRRGLRHLLANILTQLNDMDLINVSKVSTTWKKILEDDKGAFQLYNKAIQRVTVAKTLKENESLKACIRCNSPAKYDCYLQRAICNREGCGFDYCTRCLCNYHTTKECLNGKPLKANYKIGPLPGTKKSKKNLRRL
ncbi:F-box only protein 5 isoform X2 [Enhydra lutris kenyoni]|uniref:F-box only protein 5 isoform X2 n=1 Tax=Enhydra lutris kenyoni TaxID=391180 RepID=A0A2Y9KSB3_ENHLU|nr:F-box only protein 5 isoform X2 [Enhydra lutris kenyoni]